MPLNFCKAGLRIVATVLLAVLLTSSVAGNGLNARAKAPQGHHPAPAATVVAHAHARTAVPLLEIVHQPGIREHHQILADRALRILPDRCRQNLLHFSVRYTPLDRRGFAGKTTIILDGTTSDAEFIALLVHECGHVIHANMAGTPESGKSRFRDGEQIFFTDAPVARFFAFSWENERALRTDARGTDFASGYGQSDAFEDFAEFFTTYVLHRSVLEVRAAKNDIVAAKLRWMERELPLAGGGTLLARSSAAWNGTVPWDATKLQLEAASTTALTASVR